jgi:hypothetical protein
MEILVKISIPHPPPRTESISLSDLNLTREEWDRMEPDEQMTVISDYISDYDGEYWAAESFTIA